MSDAYDVVPYDDFPVAETHVDRLYVAGRRRGVACARPEVSRVLELGCAHGVNLAPMAFHLPHGRFVGVDLSESQIARGRERYASLGMANFELVAANVQSLDLRGEQFDYIVAHGLYSWVPSEVRDSILRVIRDHLAPNGIAYVSFNAMPAWGVRGAVRAALIELVSLDLEPRARVAAARRALEALGQVDALPGTAEGALLQEEFRALKSKPDAYFRHTAKPSTCGRWWQTRVVTRSGGLRTSRIRGWIATRQRPCDAASTRWCRLRSRGSRSPTC